MEKKPSILSNKSWPSYLVFFALLCASPCLDFLPTELFHPNLRHHLDGPAYPTLTAAILTFCFFKNFTWSAYSIGVLGLITQTFALPFEEKWIYLVQYSLAFGLFAYAMTFHVSKNWMFVLFSLDACLHFQLKVFYDATWPSFTGLTWEPHLSYLHQSAILILPILIFIYAYYRLMILRVMQNMLQHEKAA